MCLSGSWMHEKIIVMKFNQYIWNLYKNSPEGKYAISAFSDRKEWIKIEHRIKILAARALLGRI